MLLQFKNIRFIISGKCNYCDTDNYTNVTIVPIFYFFYTYSALRVGTPTVKF